MVSSLRLGASHSSPNSHLPPDRNLPTTSDRSSNSEQVPHAGLNVTLRDQPDGIDTTNLFSRFKHKLDKDVVCYPYEATHQDAITYIYLQEPV